MRNCGPRRAVTAYVYECLCLDTMRTFNSTIAFRSSYQNTKKNNIISLSSRYTSTWSQSDCSLHSTFPMAGTISIESILKRIIERAQECLAHPSVSASSRLFTPQSYSPRQPIANISLPDPPSMQSALLAAGACPEISLAMDQAYQKRAAELRTSCHSAVTHIYSNQAQYPSKFRYGTEQKLLSLFTDLYVRQVVAWKEEGVDLYLKRSFTRTSDNAQALSGTQKFNHVSLPFYHRIFFLTISQGICSTARILLCREPVSISRRQSFSCKKICNDISSNSCLGTHMYQYT
jgi:hypothetical protein